MEEHLGLYVGAVARRPLGKLLVSQPPNSTGSKRTIAYANIPLLQDFTGFTLVFKEKWRQPREIIASGTAANPFVAITLVPSMALLLLALLVLLL